MENDQCRDAPDGEPASQLGFDFRIDFGNTNGLFQFFCSAIEDRRHHFARAVLRRPKVDEDGNIGIVDVPVEIFFR